MHRETVPGLAVGILVVALGCGGVTGPGDGEPGGAGLSPGTGGIAASPGAGATASGANGGASTAGAPPGGGALPAGGPPVTGGATANPPGWAWLPSSTKAACGPCGSQKCNGANSECMALPSCAAGLACTGSACAPLTADDVGCVMGCFQDDDSSWQAVDVVICLALECKIECNM